MLLLFCNLLVIINFDKRKSTKTNFEEIIEQLDSKV